MSGIEQVHHELEILFEDLWSLIYDVNMHKSDLGSKVLVSLPKIVEKMGVIVRELNELRAITLAIHERRQIKDS